MRYSSFLGHLLITSPPSLQHPNGNSSSGRGKTPGTLGHEFGFVAGWCHNTALWRPCGAGTADGPSPFSAGMWAFAFISASYTISKLNTPPEKINGSRELCSASYQMLLSHIQLNCSPVPWQVLHALFSPTQVDLCSCFVFCPGLSAAAFCVSLVCEWVCFCSAPPCRIRCACRTSLHAVSLPPVKRLILVA